MTGLINDRSRNDGLGLLLPPKICPTTPEGRCYTIVGQIQVRNPEGQEKETAGVTRLCMRGGWYDSQGLDKMGFLEENQF